MHNRRLAISKPHQFARSGKTDHGGGKVAAAWNDALTNLTTLYEEGPSATLNDFHGRLANLAQGEPASYRLVRKKRTAELLNKIAPDL